MPMNDNLFNELVASALEGGEILSGLRAPARRFDFGPVNVVRIRERLSLTQPIAEPILFALAY